MLFDEAVNAPNGVLVVEVHGAQCCPVFGFHLQQGFAVSCCPITADRVLYPSVEKFDGRGILVVVKVVPGPVEIDGSWRLDAS